ncbi:glucan biosynthesis protein [Tropicimonas sediminicola]|uniref:Glucans biosynthesis protein n=1 Tax=Tropicimonas sediminicola TaxID=1031541 RepID=A0A239FT49_9RHOB|nr:glucan biosynthesis protein G [Tropicimonas sediminicola]SNS60010.1 glucans biosynthesis protein [Tropicimonas sediminicola]
MKQSGALSQGKWARRQFLCSAAAAIGAPAIMSPALVHAQQDAPAAFSFDVLSAAMQEAAGKEFAPAEQLHGFLAELDYDAYQRIRFRPEQARWSDGGGAFRLHAFHPGWLFKEPVKINEIVGDTVRQMTFTTADFEYDDEDLAASIPANAEMPGIAGFRLHTQLNRADIFDELVVFQGASYFRALGSGNTYGLSARGLAVNTGLSQAEEFPVFTEVWLRRPNEGDGSVTLYAALDSPSVTGAYRFVISPGDTTSMEVTARLFLRKDIEQLGVAPLTSMFLFSGADMGPFDDYRAAVHDSEALVLNTRPGETYFRPLNNPPQLASSYLGAMNPASFGLVQRERAFEHFLDAQAHYELRPSLMVEPIGDWGEGSVRLVEIPSDLEIHDNIVAFWVPDAPTRAGDALEFSYRLHWGMTPPGAQPKSLARVLRTRIGKGGVAGVETETGTRKFVVDFAGGLLGSLPGNAEIEPVASATNGEIVETVLSPVSGKDVWRLVMEVRAQPGSIVELKAGIAGYDRILTETWVYQWINA